MAFSLKNGRFLEMAVITPENSPTKRRNGFLCYETTKRPLGKGEPSPHPSIFTPPPLWLIDSGLPGHNAAGIVFQSRAVYGVQVLEHIIRACVRARVLVLVNMDWIYQAPINRKVMRATAIPCTTYIMGVRALLLFLK